MDGARPGTNGSDIDACYPLNLGHRLMVPLTSLNVHVLFSALPPNKMICDSDNEQLEQLLPSSGTPCAQRNYTFVPQADNTSLGTLSPWTDLLMLASQAGHGEHFGRQERNARKCLKK